MVQHSVSQGAAWGVMLTVEMGIHKCCTFVRAMFALEGQSFLRVYDSKVGIPHMTSLLVRVMYNGMVMTARS